MDLKKLREVAEAVTEYGTCSCCGSAACAYQTAMNPQTALALIAVAEAAGKVGEPVKTIVDDEACLYCLEVEGVFSSRPIKHSEDCPWLRLRLAFDALKMEVE